MASHAMIQNNGSRLPTRCDEEEEWRGRGYERIGGVYDGS